MKEKISTQFQSHRLTYYEPKGAWLWKASRQNRKLRTETSENIERATAVVMCVDFPVLKLYVVPYTSRHLNMI